MTKEEYEKELLETLEIQNGEDNINTLYLRDLLYDLEDYLPLSRETIEKAREIIETNPAFRVPMIAEEFKEDLDILLKNKTGGQKD
ncbi:MAG: hypothetical protein N3A67_00880 [Ignavibacteria bacterium]|nr:hypothetical protein [Ignavibacteria bacterium]